MNRNHEPATGPGERLAGNHLPVYNREDFLARAQGDAELVREIEKAFLEDMPEQFRRLTEAVSAGHLDAVEDRAHQIKGAAANLGAEALRAEAGAMEEAARWGERERVVEFLARMKLRHGEVIKAVGESRADE